jgi:hypothetical protein
LVLLLTSPLLMNYAIESFHWTRFEEVSKDLDIKFGDMDYLSFVGTIINALLASLLTGVVTYFVLIKTIKHGTQQYLIQKENENLEANKRVRMTYQLVVLNLLDQMKKAFGAEILGKQDPNIIGYLPDRFLVSMEILIRNIDDLMFPTEADLIFRKVEMIQNLYYDEHGVLKIEINKDGYIKSITKIYIDICELHVRLLQKYREEKL